MKDLIACYPQYYPPRDFQRSKVYAWEREQGLVRRLAGPEMEFDECEALVMKHWRRYGGDPSDAPTVKPSRRARAWYRSGSHSITLPRWARKYEQVLHETAHAIATITAHHGPVWVRVYCELLDAEGIGLFDDLVASVKAAGVKIAPKCACLQPGRVKQSDEERREQRRKWGKAYRDRKGRENEETR